MTEILLVVSIIALWGTFESARDAALRNPLPGHRGPAHLKPPTPRQIPRVRPERPPDPAPPPERSCPGCSRPMRRSSAYGSGDPTPALRCSDCDLTIYPRRA